jgi:DNA-binding LytR/AlgR family response regulator
MPRFEEPWRSVPRGWTKVQPQLRRFSQRQSTKIAIKANGRIVSVDLDDVIAVEAEGNYVSLRRRSDSHLLRESISTMAEILKPYGFVRIHRSVLVNSSFVEQIQSRPKGGYGLQVKKWKRVHSYRPTEQAQIAGSSLDRNRELGGMNVTAFHSQ